MLNKYEGVGIFVSIGLMAVALFLLNTESNQTLIAPDDGSPASVVTADARNADEFTQTVSESFDAEGNLTDMIVDDVTVGTGPSVVEGDVVSVHYIGTLQSGQQFDNSYSKGSPFEFTVGEGGVIKGWDTGVIGMQLGGQRVLVIPPELAYGKNGAGPIPGNATLIFAIELLEIK